MLRRRNVIRLALTAALGLMGAPAMAQLADDAVTVSGKTADGKAHTLTLAEIRKMPSSALTAHTPWYDGATKFEGVMARDLLKAVGAKGDTLTITALDDYAVNVPVSDLAKYDVIMAYRIDGKDLTVETKGPLFLVYPFDENPGIATEAYFSRCIWQIAKIEIK